MNDGYAYRAQVPAEASGRTLVDHLAATYRHSTAEDWRARLAQGQITLDGATAAGHEVLRAGQRLVWRRPPWDEPEVPREVVVVHDDASILVVGKPAGLPTMPAGGFLTHTLWALVRARHGDVHPVHRLGRFTSGLVVFARTSSAARILAARWHSAVIKDYLALASGTPAWDETTIETPIGPVPHPRLGTVHAAAAHGRPAASTVTVIERRDGTTLCGVRLHTGRPHQIRVHLAAAGHPLAGDPLYACGGQPLAGAPGLPGDGGYWLHAHRLRLPHPERDECLEVAATPPAPLRAQGRASATG